MRRPTRVTLWLDPLSYHLDQDRLFDAGSAPWSGESILEPYIHLREVMGALGVSVHTADGLLTGRVPPAELNLYATMSHRPRYRRLQQRADTVLSAFLVNECPVAEPAIFRDLARVASRFRRVYSFAGTDALREFTGETVEVLPYRYPYPFEDVIETAWQRRERRFLAMINANKVPRLRTRELYSERLRAVEFFSRTQEIDLYGIGWDGPAFRIGDSRTPRVLRRVGYELERRWGRWRGPGDPLLAVARTVWRGPVASKSEMLSGYTFAICFENMVLQGWVTEKLFDCLVAGTVPVYLGAPDIDDLVDPECFVDMRRFSDYAELRSFLRGLGPSEIEAYRQAGRTYLRSQQFRPFTKHALAEMFERIVAEDAGACA